MSPRERVEKVIQVLATEYPGAECELDYRSPWQLLVATVLSAQCTDRRVNQVTPELFARWPGPQEMAAAKQEQVEEVIRTTGFFRSKARSLVAAARLVMADHGGDVPRQRQALVALPGVGTKTANVVLGEAFGIAAGIAVDTHVRRVSRRLGLTSEDDPDRIAAALESFVPQEEWITFSMRLILHGRRVCSARSPACDGCCLAPWCQRVGLDPS